MRGRCWCCRVWVSWAACSEGGPGGVLGVLLPHRPLRDGLSTRGLSLALAVSLQKGKGGVKWLLLKYFSKTFAGASRLTSFFVVTASVLSESTAVPGVAHGFPLWFMSSGTPRWQLQQTQTILLYKS